MSDICIDCKKPLSNPYAESERCKKCAASHRWGNVTDAICQLFEQERLSVAEISAHVGRSRERVYQILDQCGFYMRKRQKNRKVR